MSDVHVEVRTETVWHAIVDDKEILKELRSSLHGLTTDEAAHRLTLYGLNVLTPPRKPSILAKLWAQVNHMMIWILVVAFIVVTALQEWIESGLIAGVVILNVIMGMVQEGKAEKAAEAIKAMLSASAQVVRDGTRISVAAEKLVPGDIVAIKSGDKVPADLRLLEVANLQIQEAMLTGESLPVTKNLAAVAEAAALGDRKCMVFSATAVTAGTGLGVVVATGDDAEIGKINKLVNQTDSGVTNLVIQMEILGRWLAVIVVLIALGAFLLAYFAANEAVTEALESAVAIAVAMIPEGLPALVTVVLALGTKKMAKHNAIIRKLPCVETLGSLTVICSDKTGTLTKNEMTMVGLRTATAHYDISGVGYAPEGNIMHKGQQVQEQQQLTAVCNLLEGGVLCNDSGLICTTSEDGAKLYAPNGAPTEVAFITAAIKAGVVVEDLKRQQHRVALVPFESEHKFMASVHQLPETAGAAGVDATCQAGTVGGLVMYVKGAPDRVLPMCKAQLRQGGDPNAGAGDLDPVDPAFWQLAQEELSSQGLRVLALCRAYLPAGQEVGQLSAAALLQRPPFLTMLALVAIMDPPREEAVDAVREAKQAGITVKMITGDHALTALAIGKMIGIATNDLVLTGPEIDAMSDTQLTRVAMQCHVYARASPENKLRIVQALQCGPGPLGVLDGDAEEDDGPPIQRNGGRQVVAMTGDGVNDAPALKAADIGVAMGITGTDVSREAAKMVLADDNFATIITAVKEGRRVWDNLRKILLFNLPVNFAQGGSIFWAYVVGFEHAPLTAIQVLYVNLVTSVTMGAMLAAEPAEDDIMSRPPRRPGKRLLGKLILWRCVFVSHIIIILVLGMFGWASSEGRSLAQCRAEAFNTLVFAEIGYSITARFIKQSTLHPRALTGNPMCYVSIAITAGLQFLITYTPGLKWFFNLDDGLDGIQWARVAVCMVVLFLIVEVEKALVDPVFVPIIAPFMGWVGGLTPTWLREGPQCIRPKVEDKAGVGEEGQGQGQGQEMGKVPGEVRVLA